MRLRSDEEIDQRAGITSDLVSTELTSPIRQVRHATGIAPGIAMRAPGRVSCHQEFAAVMSFVHWLLIVGALLLLVALTSGALRKAPLTPAILYLLVGVALGPLGFDVVKIDLVARSHWLERLTEIALVVSLFATGLKLRQSPRNYRWHPAYWLAGPIMVLTIAAIAVAAHLLFGFDWAAALLLAAILAPTDPVLASAVRVDDASDGDTLRFALTGESGLNDGCAFPFVFLALALLANAASDVNWSAWVFASVLWGIAGGLSVGWLMGSGVGRLAMSFRIRFRDTSAPTDFLALALIALSYAVAETIETLGFLAVFAAGVGLRAAEVRASQSTHVDAVSQPAENLVTPHLVTEREIQHPTVAAGVVVAEAQTVGDTLERTLELLLVSIVGLAVASYWSTAGALLAILLVGVIRPLCCALVSRWIGLSRAQLALVAWFGVRGIGSIFYLCYALQHGVSGPIAAELCAYTITIVTISIVIHGLSGVPLLRWYRNRLGATVASLDSADKVSAKNLTEM